MIRVDWNSELLTGDVVVGPNGLHDDTGLLTPVLLSLFTDGRAKADDPLPHGAADRRGWVGDALDDEGDRYGSRLWLLRREKETEETRRRAVEYATEALQWLIRKGMAAHVGVDAAWVARGLLRITVKITRGADVVAFDFNYQLGEAAA